MQAKDGQFGVNVWWTVPADIRMGIEKVQGALDNHGFEKKDMPEPTRRAIVSRACYSFQNRQTKENRRVTEKARESMSDVVYGILDLRHEDAEEVGYRQHTAVKLDKASGRVSVEGNMADQVREAIEQFSGSYTDDDIRYFLRHVVGMCFGVPKRPTGGIYFVPEQFAGIVRSAAEALREIDCGAKLYFEGVVNGQQERRNVWEAVEQQISDRVEETVAAVNRIEKRVSAISNHEEKLNALKNLMEVYSGLLGEEARHQNVSERLEDAVKLVASKMAEMQGATPVQRKPVSNQSTANKIVAKSVPRGKKSEWLKIAHGILIAKGEPMNYIELTEEALKAGLETEVKCPSDGMFHKLRVSIAKNEGLFEKVGPGKFAAI